MMFRKMATIARLWVALSLIGATAPCWAGDNDASGYQPEGSGSYQYQPVPGPEPSGSIIGYHPIPANAFNGPVTVSVSPVQPGAQITQAAPAAMAVYPGQPTTRRGRRGDPAAAATQSDLPVSYLTGIIGEGFYTLGRDDIIRVIVRNQPEFSGDFIIGFDGRIQYNYLGDIPVAGLTKYEVQQALGTLLKRYVRLPDVNVSIMAYNSKVVYVIGEVNAPGKFIMRGDAIKLREAILAAGLPTRTAALGRVHVIKPDLEKPIVRVINLTKILYQGQLKDDVELSSGEIVVVPSTVMSKVNTFLGNLLSPVTHAASVAWLAAL